jgi:hypothetical protein
MYQLYMCGISLSSYTQIHLLNVEWIGFNSMQLLHHISILCQGFHELVSIIRYHALFT